MSIVKLSKIVTVQIPMAVELRDALKLKAQYFGFGSIQDLVRFWAMAQVEGRQICHSSTELAICCRLCYNT